MNQAEKIFGKTKTDRRVKEALKQHPLMTDEQLKMFYVAVLQIAAYSRGYKRKAKELIRVSIVPEMIRRKIL